MFLSIFSNKQHNFPLNAAKISDKSICRLCWQQNTLMLETLQIPKRDVCEKPSQGFLSCPAIKSINKQNLCFVLTIAILARVSNVSFYAMQSKGDPEFGILELQSLATQSDRLNIWSNYVTGEWVCKVLLELGEKSSFFPFAFIPMKLQSCLWEGQWSNNYKFTGTTGINQPYKHRAEATVLFCYCPHSLEILWRDFSM